MPGTNLPANSCQGQGEINRIKWFFSPGELIFKGRGYQLVGVNELMPKLK
jgi:hypothetical protein